MTQHQYRVVPVVAVLFLVRFLSACSTMPSGPQVQAMPGTGKSLTQFNADGALCQKNAMDVIAGKTSSQPATSKEAQGTVPDSAAKTAPAASDSSKSGLQRRYDFAYFQCMYSKGHRVPVLDKSRL